MLRKGPDCILERKTTHHKYDRQPYEFYDALALAHTTADHYLSWRIYRKSDLIPLAWSNTCAHCGNSAHFFDDGSRELLCIECGAIAYGAWDKTDTSE